MSPLGYGSRGQCGRRRVAELVERVDDRGAVVRGLGDRAQGADDVGADQLGRAERGQRRDPVDRLGHAGRLVEIEQADPADERRVVEAISGSFAAGTERRRISAARAGAGNSIQW